MSWGLVLSGGAAFGLANIGVLEALEERGLRPDYVAGSSMGAIVGAVYALGHSPASIRALAASLKPVTVAGFSPRPLRGGLHGGLLSQRLEEHLGELLGDACIGECEIPFVCVAGRVEQPVRWERAVLPGFTAHLRESIHLHVFGPEVRLLDAIQASSAIPVVFSPARVGEQDFVDLVHFGAIPSRSLREAYAPDVVVATDTMPHWDQLEPWLPPSLREFLSEGRTETERSLAASDLVIRPELSGTFLRFDLGDAFANAGKLATLASMEDIERLAGTTG